MSQFPSLVLLVSLLFVLACHDAPPATATASASPAPHQRTIYVSAIPDENPTELIRKYQPLVQHLEKALGTKVKYVPVTDYGAAVSALAAGKVDFAWLGAFTHVQARHQTKVVPLCMRQIDRQFKSVIIKSNAAGISEVPQIKGKKFAFGSKSSTSGHLMPRYFLTSSFGIDVDNDFNGPPMFSGSHDATVKMVESGRVAAGAVNALVWQRMQADKQVDPNKVAVLWTTPAYVDYVWTARLAIDEALRQKFLHAFIDLNLADPNDAAVLKLQDAKKFVAASPSDFDAVEKIALSTGLLKPAKP